MPKLNTTVDNIELKSNKIISTNTASPDTWTDAQYLSAKALLNIAHPIGSILITETNTNPESTLGGTWELVDKAFEKWHKTLDPSFWTAKNANLLTDNSSVTLIDHMLCLRMNFTSTAALNDDPQDIGTIDLQKCGIVADGLSHDIMFDPIISDNGNCIMNFRMSKKGVVSIHEVLNINNTHIMDIGSNFYINILQPIDYEKMENSFCDKFYWKRLA